MFADPENCDYIAGASLGGEPGWIAVYSAFWDPRIYADELGHNLTLQHAASLKCRMLFIDFYQNCIYDEYGDYFDIMGNFWYVTPYIFHFNAPHKLGLNWIGPASVKEATATGTYQIYHSETSTTNTQILKVYKADTNVYYYLSYRQPLGFGAGLYYGLAQGASIHLWNNDPLYQTQFLDSTPMVGDFNCFGDATLSDGQEAVDQINGLTFTQLSHNGDFTEVQVTLADKIQPEIYITCPIYNQLVKQKKYIKVQAAATDNIGVTKVEFRRNGVVKCIVFSEPFFCNMYNAKVKGVQVTNSATAYDAAGNSTSIQTKVTTK